MLISLPVSMLHPAYLRTACGTMHKLDKFAVHNCVVGVIILGYSLFVGPVISPYSRTTPAERSLGVNYLRDVVEVDPRYYAIGGVFAVLNYVDGLVLAATTLGILRRKPWGFHLTYLWALYSIGLALVAVLVHYFFVASPESEMLQGLTRGDPVDTWAVQLYSRIMLFTSSWLAVCVVVDALGTVAFLKKQRLSRLDAVFQMCRDALSRAIRFLSRRGD